MGAMAHPSAAAARKGEYPEGHPLQDPENLQRYQQAREVFLNLVKGIKQINLYQHATGKYAEFLGRAHASLAGWTETHGPLNVKVDSGNFFLFKEPLLDEGDFSYRFFRDGIRNLVFRPGLTLDELVQFTLIAIKNYDAPEHHGEDIVQNLWQASFSNIEYIIVEGFKIGDMSEEAVQVEVDKIVSYLYGRLRSTSEDFLRFARVSAEDLETKLDNIDQVRGAVIAGESATQKLRELMEEELRLDEQERLLGKLVVAIFQVLEEGGVEDRATLEELFVQLLDALLMQEDFAAINSILVKFRSLERDPRRQAQIRDLRSFFLAKMGEGERLQRIGQILQNSKIKSPQDVLRYLSQLDAGSVVPLLDVLDVVTNNEHRSILVDALSSIGRDLIDPFVMRLQSDKSQLVRDMLTIIERLDPPNKLEIYGQVLKHPSLPVKLEAFGVVSKSRTEQCRRFVVEALGDGNQQLRILAARALPNYGGEKALADLIKIAKAPEFEKKAWEEKANFYQAMGMTQLPAAMQYFQFLLAQKSLFQRAKIREGKLLAIAGLGACVALASYKILQGEVENKANEPEVLTAARRSMYEVKKQLFGEQPVEGES